MSAEITSGLRPQFYDTVSDTVRKARARACRAVNVTMVETYWNVGRLIFEEEQQGSMRAQYAAYLIANLAVRLTAEFGRGYGEANLRNFRQFYLAFPVEKGRSIRYTLCSELTWSHYRALMRVPKHEARYWYMQEAASQGWPVRDLSRQINSCAYERTLRNEKQAGLRKKSRKKADRRPIEPREFIKDPYVLEFLETKGAASLRESSLEQAIIDRLQEFMLELGKGFAFVGRQFRVSTETKHFFIDLVFYNYILKCFVLVDLKTGELTHQDIGQMDMYVRVFEDKMRGGEDSPTVGLILCSEKDRSLVKYSVLNESKQLFASKYRSYLPSEDELRAEIDRERDLVLEAGAPRDAEASGPVPLIAAEG